MPGQDDVRKIDWAVTARTTIPYVRDTIADRELEIWALLDVTPSMNWGTEGVTKRDLGIAAIATIGFLSQKMGDRFGGLVMRPDQIKRYPAMSGRTALYGLLRRLLTEPIVTDHTTGPFSLAAGIQRMARTERRRGMRMIVSDFLTPGDFELDPNVEPEWERPIRQLAVRNQVLAVEVVDRHEVEFADVGELLIRDPETDFLRYVNTSDDAARERMDAATAAQRERIRIALRRAGAAHIQLRTDRDWVHDIARFVLAYRRTAEHAAPAAAGGDPLMEWLTLPQPGAPLGAADRAGADRRLHLPRPDEEEDRDAVHQHRDPRPGGAQAVAVAPAPGGGAVAARR